MPSLLSTEGIPSATPSGIGDDYQRVQTSPDMFGAAMGHANQQLAGSFGALAQDADRIRTFYNQVTADDAYNQTADFITKKMHGDPNTTNPDGTPDTGFMGMKGSSALDGRKRVMDEIDSYIKAQRANLKDPEAIMAFERESRRLRTLTMDQVGRHADGQFTQYTNGVNNGTANSALNRIAANPTDDAGFEVARHDLTNAYVKESMNIGQNSPEALKSAEEKATRDAMKARALAIGANDPSGAMKYIDEHSKELGTEYATLHQHFEAKANKATGTSAGAAAFADANASVSSGRQPQAAPPEAAGMLRRFEGYRSQAYWDVNHWRVGYGSDTITRADGTVEPVTAFTKGITVADAERDLARRVGLIENDVKGKIGADKWASLPPAARAAITSVGYNYGTTPRSVIEAAKGGDPTAIASAIASLPANPKRRSQEAGAIFGKFGFSGPEATTGYAPNMQMPAFEGMPQGEPANTEPANAPPVPEQPAPTVTGTAPTPAPQPQPSQMSPEEKYAAIMSEAYRRIEQNTSLNDQQKDAAYAHVHQMAQNFAIMEGVNEKARKRANETAADEWDRKIANGKFDAGTYNQIVNDPRITDPHTRHLLTETLKKAAGPTSEQRAMEYGKGYQGLLERIAAPKDDGQRIASANPILEAYVRGDISEAGKSSLMGILKEAAEGKTGNATLMSTALERAKRTMVLNSVKDQFTGTTKDDEAGQAKLEEFTHVFVEGLQKQIESGKSVAEYTDPKNVDKLIEQIYPRTERISNALSFGQGSLSADTARKLQPELPPAGIDEKAWFGAVDSRPTINGTQLPPYTYSRMLTILAANPTPEAIQRFNALNHGAVDGKAILQKLGVVPAATQAGQFSGEITPEMAAAGKPHGLYEKEEIAGSMRKARGEFTPITQKVGKWLREHQGMRSWDPYARPVEE